MAADVGIRSRISGLNLDGCGELGLGNHATGGGRGFEDDIVACDAVVHSDGLISSIIAELLFILLHSS